MMAHSPGDCAKGSRVSSLGYSAMLLQTPHLIKDNHASERLSDLPKVIQLKSGID